MNAAGPWASQIAKLAGIGDGEVTPESRLDSKSVSLPVEARKRYIYMFYAENGPILRVPLTIDHTGVFWKRQGLSNLFIKFLSLSVISLHYFHRSLELLLLWSQSKSRRRA